MPACRKFSFSSWKVTAFGAEVCSFTRSGCAVLEVTVKEPSVVPSTSVTTFGSRNIPLLQSVVMRAGDDGSSRGGSDITLAAMVFVVTSRREGRQP